MAEEIKTPVQIIQELIALHTTRKESAEKLDSNNPSGSNHVKFTNAARQSEQFMSELLEELSAFGDAVQGDVDRENEYHNLWTNTLAKNDSLNEQQSVQTFENMERTLVKMYEQYLSIETELATTLREMLAKQAKELTQ
jgi:hypothetical protein